MSDHAVFPASKACTKCGVVKPLSEFHARAKSPDGRSYRCRQCASGASKRIRERNKQEKKEEFHKPCSKCGVVKPPTEFVKCSSSPDGRRGQCKQCLAVVRAARCSKPGDRQSRNRKAREYIAGLPTDRKEALLERQRQQRGTPEGKAKRKEQDLRYRTEKAAREGKEYKEFTRKAKERMEEVAAKRAAREAWKHWIEVRAPEWWRIEYGVSPAQRYAARYRTDGRFREKEKKRSALYKNENPGKLGEWKDNRKAKVAKVDDGTLADGGLKGIWAERKYCPYCGKAMKTRAPDHMDPIAMGGAHSLANIVMCCKPCNNRKHARPFSLWLTMIEEPYRSRCRRMYEKMKGAPAEQMGIEFLFK